MAVAILGYTGLVGSHLLDHIIDADLYNSSNLSEIAGKAYDTIYCACIPAVKWKANAEPEEDMRSIQQIQKCIDQVRACSRFVLISTIDVHDARVQEQTEDESTFVGSQEPYGRHRRDFEQWVMARFEKVHIVRLPALFGMNLKKNALYDLLHRRRLEYINLEDEFQWYDLQWLNDDVQKMIRCDILLLHLYTPPIRMLDVVAYCFPQCLPSLMSEREQARAPIRYHQRTLYDWARRSAEEVLASMLRFVKIYESRCWNRLMVSSFHWKPNELAAASRILRHYGINQIELVPGSYLDWKSETVVAEAFALRHLLMAYGISVASIQGILHGLDATIQDHDSILQRLALASDVAATLGASTMVFGAPRARSVGDLSDLSTICEKYMGDTVLCVEHVASAYGCKVGTKFKEVAELARLKRVGVNADIGNALMEDDNSFDWSHPSVCHAQISMPHLGSLDAAILRDGFHRYGTPLGKVSLEVQSDVRFLAKHVYTLMCELAMAEARDYPTLVIGAGWYGCYAAMLLKNVGRPFILYDPVGIFAGSSLCNQNRLHLGYHYPRSAKTRRECLHGFRLFKEKFPHLSIPIANYYVISRESLMDHETYMLIYGGRSDGDKEPFPFLLNYDHLDGNAICVDEEYIDPFAAQAYFQNLFGKDLISDPSIVADGQYARVLDCTYGRLMGEEDYMYELCITFVLRQKVAFAPIALTVMDGPFFSIYPYDVNKGLYTLTHVLHTPCKVSSKPIDVQKEGLGIETEKIRQKMETDARKYIHNYDDLFEVVSHFCSTKTKLKNASTDDRSVSWKKRGSLTSVMGGKITGIFSLDELVH